MADEREQTGSVLSGGGTPDLESAIEKLMAHPEILEMAASVLGEGAENGNGSRSSAESEPSTEEASTEPQALSASAPLPELLKLAGPLLSRGGSGKHSAGLRNSTALLIALKPYLSDPRCKTVDRIVEISKLGTIFDALR